MGEIREMIEKRLAIEIFVNQEVNRTIKIQPWQIEEFYQAHRDDYTRSERIRLQMLVLQRPSKSAAAAAAERVAGGEDFAAIAKDQKKISLREIWMATTQLSKELRSGLDSFDAGTTSTAVKVGNDVYFLHVAEREEARQLSLADMAEEIRQTLFEEERQKRHAEFIRRMRAKSYIRVFFEE
jgi:parvulin-like peptidyl-prolyl isomerase